jgi:hypothetical protein
MRKERVVDPDRVKVVGVRKIDVAVIHGVVR